MRFLPILMAATAAAVTAQSPLTTTFAGGNGQSGNMFEVNALNAAGITVTAFEVNTNSTTVGDFEVYGLVGNYAGNENNAAAWTLIGAATGVPCNGAGVATALPICVDTFVAAGTTQSFYVTHSDTNIVAYTNGTLAGNVYASNADLEFIEGSGHAYPFQANFTPRVWNGNIFYNVGNTSGGAGCTFADISSYGAGCGGSGFASFRELQPSATMDLDGTIITGLNTGAGYLVQAAPGAGNVSVGLNAAVMALGDDDFQDSATVGGTLGINVGSNCNISLGGANGNGFTPDPAVMMANAFEGLYAWTDIHVARGFDSSQGNVGATRTLLLNPLQGEPAVDPVILGDVHVGKDLKINSSQVNKFVFEMGVERLDAYLSFQVEESIRGLVYDVNHDRVNDLRSEFASDMLAVLQQKVERFGVDIKAVKITNVALPRELQERLESTPASRRSRDFLREDGETSPPPRVGRAASRIVASRMRARKSARSI